MQLFPVALALAASLLGFAQAQNSTYPYLVQPGSVPVSMRISWCTDERSACNSLCLGGTSSNNCDPDTLIYTCTCSSGNSPNMTQYNQTLPFYECQTFQQQCVAMNPTNATAQMACNAIPCGGKSVAAAASSASASAAASTAPSSSSSSSASATASSASSSSTAAHSGAAAVSNVRDSTLGMLAFVVSAGFLFGGLAL